MINLFSQKEIVLKARQGFTLIESLTVIAIIGILLSLSVYLITQAQRQARDAVRKSDVSAIAQGFEARYLDKTCLNQADVGFYPGVELISDTNPTGRMPWTKVEDLNGAAVDSCNPYSTYLSVIPKDPKTATEVYYFNLSTGATKGKHYRIAAKLEKDPTTEQWDEICRLSDVWYEDFGGTRFAGPVQGCGGEIAQNFGPQISLGFLGIIGKVQAREVLDDPPPGGGSGGGGSGGSGGGGSGGGVTPCEPTPVEGPP
ncbi:MAG: type II secretion system protein, partial [Patescibacteria group bacterium]